MSKKLVKAQERESIKRGKSKGQPERESRKKKERKKKEKSKKGKE